MALEDMKKNLNKHLSNLCQSFIREELFFGMMKLMSLSMKLMKPLCLMPKYRNSKEFKIFLYI